jgi:hypothetical protein
MAKSKKSNLNVAPAATFRLNNTPEPIATLRVGSPEKIANCEWCFQFDGDEPMVFATGNEFDYGAYVQFKLTASKNSSIKFHDAKSNKNFKLFVRKKT